MDTQKKARLGTMILEQLASDAKRTASELDLERKALISRLKPTAKQACSGFYRMLTAPPVDF